MMSPTVEVELVAVGVGIVAGVLAMLLHSSNIAVTAMLMTVLAAYAAWLDWRS